MTPLCPRPALCHHFLPSLLRSAMQSARGARQRAEAGGLSGFRTQTCFPRRASSPQCESCLPSQPERWTRPAGGGGWGGASGKFWFGRTPVSPSKRARPAEEGGMQLRFARLSEHATAPTRGSARAAGYDLYSAYDYTIPPMEKALVKTDIQIALPSGCYGRVAPRSGLAAKHFIDVGAGVIDEDYRGNVGVVLFNFGKEKFEVKKGDRIAQLICERIFYPEIEEVQALDDTERGSGGFGSTGKN
uniref:Deoxyuridine 5'-triphosphate nucleotidohydrolase n=1 Tax=Saimiri boliviensis boliviensis TaxID=39432 RepID=A0A2K6UUY5_SAIBB